MKKLSVLLIVVFILNICIIGSVFAANVCKISASFSPSNPNPGNELKISISASDITEGITAVSFTLDYDSQIFDFTGVEKADGWTISQTENLFSMITDDYNATSKSGKIGVIKLKVKEGASLGNTSIKLTSIKVAKEDASIISIGEINQNITIEKVSTKPSENTTNTNTNTTNNTKNTNNTANSESVNTNTNSAKSNTSTNNEKNNNNVETKKAESKNSNLPYTGYAIKGIGLLLVVIIFSIFSYKKYFKYKNI